MRKIEAFCESEDGSTAMIFAMLILSIIVMMGGGLDFSKHRTQSLLLQTAVDMTALHMVQQVDIPPAEVQRRARRFFNANSSALLAPVTEFTATKDGNVFHVGARADVSTNFLGLIGIETLAAYRKAESLLTLETREIALVLDTTGSMSGSRLASLKSAANILLDSLETGSAGAELYHVGVVPFNNYVRVNPSDFDPAWLDTEGRSEVAMEIFDEEINLLELFDHLGEPWAGCMRTRSGDFAYTDAPVEASDLDSHFLPYFAYDEGDDGSYLNNYITDAVAHTDGVSSVQSVVKYGIPAGVGGPANTWSPVTTSITSDVGPNRGCNSEPIIPLTDNLDDVRDTVDNLVARGDTNLTEAIVWGQRVLSDRPPFTNAKPDNEPGHKKIIIFLSDGINSTDGGNSDLRSPLNAHGYAAIGEQASQLPPNPLEDDINDYLNSEFTEACEAIKAEGTKIFVIRLELTDATSFDLLRNCATSEADFFDVPDASQLEGVFSELGQRVSAVRLTL